MWDAFIDVQAVPSGRVGAGVIRGYLFKDLLKQTRADLGPSVISQANITQALNWFFGKRSFSVSGRAVLADLTEDLHNSNREREENPVLELVDTKNLTFLGVVQLDMSGTAPFFVVLPGSVVRNDDRFRVLREMAELRERKEDKVEPLPEWSGWNDARCVPMAYELLKAIQEAKEIQAEKLEGPALCTEYASILDEQLSREGFRTWRAKRGKRI